jgi:hypothetical protein
MWYLLDMFHGLGYSILFVLGLVWLWLLLQVVEDALAPQRKGMHRFVHPLPNPPTSRRRRCQGASLNRAKFFRSRFQLREEILMLESVFMRGRVALTVAGSRSILG